MQGLEPILAKEVAQLGGAKIKSGYRVVECSGDLGFVYKANFSLRTALKILVPIVEFTAGNEHVLYKKLLQLNWENYLQLNQSFAIGAVVSGDYFNNSHYVALKTKDAIVDYFKQKFQKRPSVSKQNPDILFNLHIRNKQITLSLDSSAYSLHLRNYKLNNGQAPINEVLAAGMLLLSGWEGKGDFLDPMCGSGTILIEAAMIALNIPPQIHRERFGFMQWRNFDSKLWALIKQKRIDKINDYDNDLIGYDIDDEMIEIAKQNVESAGLEEFITIKKQNFLESKKEQFPVHILFNPPYNERLQQSDPEFYAKIGKTIKFNYPNSFIWFITNNPQAKKTIGLKPSKKIKLFNGKLECDFLCYETYLGTRKAKKNKNN